MKSIIAEIRTLVDAGDIQLSRHGFRRLAERGISVLDCLDGIGAAEVVDTYADNFKGPSVLVSQKSRDGQPLHVLWGVANGTARPAILITAYVPRPDEWTADYLTRRNS